MTREDAACECSAERNPACPRHAVGTRRGKPLWPEGGRYPQPDVVSTAARHIYGAVNADPDSAGWAQMERALESLAHIGLRLVAVDPSEGHSGSSREGS